MSNQSSKQSLTERARQAYDEPVAHPFRVGEMYANRRGNYEVMQIAPPKMTIRYDNGELITADIVILARIWDNMKSPPELPEAPARRTTTRAPARQPAAARTTRRTPKAED